MTFMSAAPQMAVAPVASAQNIVLDICGYASRFDKVDLSGDKVRKGAFSASLLSRYEALPMLFNHETDIPIGVWDSANEDEVGLYVCGRLFLGTPEADRVAKLIMQGSLNGLSIGFRTVRHAQRIDGGRDLFDLELWEVSIVDFPMLPSARLTEIGSVRVTGSTLKDDIISLPQAN